jgi:hypothetical protein
MTPESDLAKLPPRRIAALVDLANDLIELCAAGASDEDHNSEVQNRILALTATERAALAELLRTALILADMVHHARHPTPPAPANS